MGVMVWKVVAEHKDVSEGIDYSITNSMDQQGLNGCQTMVIWGPTVGPILPRRRIGGSPAGLNSRGST